MKRRTVLHALPAAGLLAACGQNQRTDQPGSAPQPAGKPVRGGTLVALMPQDAVNFDPVRQSDAYAQSVLNQVVDT
ncbi:MAG TPA: hypothetical protein VHN78_08195, partial [Chloroflexota bacterium]|nr:hypothetical protein [Chloroflexota bacterium]